MSIVRIAKISGVATSYQNIGNIKKHNSNENINQPQTNPIENSYKDFNINRILIFKDIKNWML